MAPHCDHESHKNTRSTKPTTQAHAFCRGQCFAASLLWRTACTMLLATTGYAHVYIIFRSCASFRCCQRFLVTAHHSISSSAMLRNLSTINMETPRAKGSTDTSTKEAPAYASGGQTFAPRLMSSTRAIQNSKPLRKTNTSQHNPCAHGKPEDMQKATSHQ